MEYGCVFVMRHRQGLSAEAPLLNSSGRGWGQEADPSVKGTCSERHSKAGKEIAGGGGLPEPTQQT